VTDKTNNWRKLTQQDAFREENSNMRKRTKLLFEQQNLVPFQLKGYPTTTPQAFHTNLNM
jgi:hypothetical protein